MQSFEIIFNNIINLFVRKVLILLVYHVKKRLGTVIDPLVSYHTLLGWKLCIIVLKTIQSVISILSSHR